MAQFGMAIMRNYDASKAPEGFPDFADFESFQTFVDEFEFRPQRPNESAAENRRRRVARSLRRRNVVSGFFNYDFRRTEMCVIPYGTQEGEISFCAYNTGVGWRQIIEEMHKTASLPNGIKNTVATPFTPKARKFPASAKRAV
jgi:hypothetical protein